MFKDNLKYGLVIGALSPFLGMLGFYYWKFSVYSFKNFITALAEQKTILTSMISFSLLVNAIIFTIFLNKSKDYTAKGIFITTVIWAVFAIVLKLIY